MDGRQRRPASFWEPLVEEWKSSGLGLSRFAVLKGIAPNSFAYWVKRAGSAGEQRMVPVTVTGEEVAAIEVAVRGAVLRMPAGISAAWVAELLVRAERG